MNLPKWIERREIRFVSNQTVWFSSIVFSGNSPMVIGFTYGFLSAFEIGVSIFFLLRDYMLCESKGKKFAAETGLILGHLFLCFSIYSKPFHLIFRFSREMSLCIWIYFLICLFFSIRNNTKDWILTSCEEKERSPEWKLTAIAIQAFSMIYLFLNHIFLQFINLFLFPSPIFSRLIHLFLFRIITEKKNIFLISSFLGWLFGYFILRNVVLKFISYLLLYLYENRGSNPRLKRQSRFPITRIESKKEREKRFEKNEWIESEKQLWANRFSCILLFFVFILYSLKMPKFVRIGMYHPIFDTTVSTTSIFENRFADHEEKYKTKEKEFEKKEGSSEKRNRNSENSNSQDEDSDHFGEDPRSYSYPKQNSEGIESQKNQSKQKKKNEKEASVSEFIKQISEIGIATYMLYKCRPNGDAPGGGGSVVSGQMRGLRYIDGELEFVDLQNRLNSLEKIKEFEEKINVLERLRNSYCELLQQDEPDTPDYVLMQFLIQKARNLARRKRIQLDNMSRTIKPILYYSILTYAYSSLAMRMLRTFT